MTHMLADGRLPEEAQAKVDLLFEGIRFTEALGAAGEDAFPNFYPYRFAPGEPDPTGKGSATIPYLLTLEKGTLVRLRGERGSPWSVDGSLEAGFRLERDGGPGWSSPIRFEPLPAWLSSRTSDGMAMADTGVSLHGDMAVINVAPGCEYFLTAREHGESLRCTFCAYGAPDARSRRLGQEMRQAAIPDPTYRRLQETLAAAVEEEAPSHVYLVGGSMEDWAEEGERYIELARRVQEVVDHRIPVACGSGALPHDSLERLHGEGLVDAVCFNLEVWSERLFARICPGKNRFVGYRRWLASLERAAELWGPGRVYTAMVAGIELEPEHEMTPQAAAALALEGAEELCRRGVIPIYSLYFPVGGRMRPQERADLKGYFEAVAAGYREIRERLGVRVWDGFMCHRCAYMQLECDMDRL